MNDHKVTQIKPLIANLLNTQYVKKEKDRKIKKKQNKFTPGRNNSKEAMINLGLVRKENQNSTQKELHE